MKLHLAILLSVVIIILVNVLVPTIYTVIIKKESFTIKAWRLINRIILDSYDKKIHRYFGFTLFCGKQGGGKTYSAVKYCYDLAKRSGGLLVSNTPLDCPGDINYMYLRSLRDIKYLPESSNYIILLDEIQVLFDTHNFDNEFYTIFCQLRKRNITIVGTAQVFERVALKLREQVNTLYYCRTFFGAVTRVKEYYPDLNSSGKLSSKGSFILGNDWYIQEDFIRNMYNTYFKI